MTSKQASAEPDSFSAPDCPKATPLSGGLISGTTKGTGRGAKSSGSPLACQLQNNKHLVRAGSYSWVSDEDPDADLLKEHKRRIEPWLAALLQVEHLNLLVGSGLTAAVGRQAKAPPVTMAPGGFNCVSADAVHRAARTGAERAGRGDPNLEDEIRAALELIAGLQVLSQAQGGGAEGIPPKGAAELLDLWEKALDGRLKSFLGAILSAEQGIHKALAAGTPESNRIRRLVGSFLLTFGSRTATRERLHIFTTNYDRLIEYGCDLLGLRVLDRFVGRLNPIFRASRLGVDMHYNPPGIRGEPRYLEGVVRLSKLHGSVDWRLEKDGAGGGVITRSLVPFGAPSNHPGLPTDALKGLLIYPNPAKDMETLEYPYAELFRDFAAAVCQPNAVLVTYGYGFGDDHVNRILRDMLTIPSTHLAILSYDNAGGRVSRFCDSVGHDEQMTLLVGPHFGDLATLVEHYLPKPAIDRTTLRMVDLVNRRTVHRDGEGRGGGGGGGAPEGEA